MKIPNWLTSHLNEKGLTDIRDSVTRAEGHTIGEIVPMIVRSSSPVGHIAFLLFFMFLAIFDLVLFILMSQIEVLHLAKFQILGVIFSFALGLLLSKSHLIQRILTPKGDRHHNALVRAELEFHRSQIRSTSSHAGVLLFVSLMERQAVVLADEKVVKKMTVDSWNPVLKTLTQGLKAKDFAVGFSSAIEQAGLVLKNHFPVREHTHNDLPNDLQIKE